MSTVRLAVALGTLGAGVAQTPIPPIANPAMIILRERTALLSFKAAGDPHNVLESWNPGTNPCDAGATWFGVGCNEDGRVASISLPGHRTLRGTLAHLTALTEVETLDLFGCHRVSGSLNGPALQGMVRLNVLFVGDTSVYGDLAQLRAEHPDLDRPGSEWSSGVDQASLCTDFSCTTGTNLIDDPANTVGNDACTCCIESTFVRDRTGLCVGEFSPT